MRIKMFIKIISTTMSILNALLSLMIILDSQMTRALVHHLETELVTQRVNAPVEEGRILDHALR